MPDQTRHQCSVLKEFGQYLKLDFPEDRRYTRWTLRHEPGKETQETDPVVLQVVLFCPGCGLDLRKDCSWQIPGRPGFNATLREAVAQREAREQSED